MSAKFLENLGGKLAEQWIATLLTPAFVFWAGGAIALIQRSGWDTISKWFENQLQEVQQITLLVGILCLIVSSAFVVQRFDLPVLRFLEGYWHPWLQPLRQFLIKRQITHSKKLNRKFQSLAKKLISLELTKTEEQKFWSLQELNNFTQEDWNKCQELQEKAKQFEYQKNLKDFTQDQWNQFQSLSREKEKRELTEEEKQNFQSLQDLNNFTQDNWNKCQNLKEREKHFEYLESLKDFTQDQWEQFQLLSKKEQYRKEQQNELIQIDQQINERPFLDKLMPTRLGNILRAAEQKPREKYGLDAIVCWPHLWLLLPDAVKKDLQEARADLDTAARIWLWSLLFCFWTFVTPWPLKTVPLWFPLLTLWPLLLGLVSAAFAYYVWALDAAETYGVLIEATFDLYRHLLYQSIRWYLPPEPDNERIAGEKLNEYLWRGF